jgi:phosphatidylserine decarboxylase
MQPIVERLVQLIEAHAWQAAFQQALDHAAAQDVAQIAHIRTLPDYLHYIDELVRWAPRESGDSRLVHDKLVEFHFVLDQPPLRGLQSPLAPRDAGDGPQQLTPLSRWMRDFALAWGSYLDTPESAAHIDTFRTNPAFRWADYMPPPSGYRSFNQFFARHVRPGRRPVDKVSDDRVVVSPADANFIGAWPIADDATVHVNAPPLDLKGLRWSIAQLLDDSPYAGRFAGGVFSHSALRTFDYHRWHAPVRGTVLEARVVQGQVWLDVVASAVVDSEGRTRNVLRALEGTGYQFVQTRGLVVLDSPAGLVACLPVGMAQVSSVVITAEVGSSIRKGEELGYFQFGGSDFVMVFERGAELALACQPEQHVLQGAAVGVCNPYQASTGSS